MLGGTLTAAAVFRVGFHTFLGWGTTPLTDRAAIIDELPEDKIDDDKTFWYHIFPPILCVAGAIAITLIPHLREHFLAAANRLTFQPGYLHAVYTGTTPVLATPQDLDLSATHAALHGAIAVLLALALALTSVFRAKLSRRLRLGAFLEGPLTPLRILQSGHVGDYVLWLTIGTATLGTAYMLFLH